MYTVVATVKIRDPDVARETLAALRCRQFESGGSSAAPMCSNQTYLRMTLADLFYGSDLPERPSPTSRDWFASRGSGLTRHC
jgi:hypothetical protein